MIQIERLQTPPPPNPGDEVRLKITGDIFEIRKAQRESNPPILKISKEEYINLNEKTGEVKTFRHRENRAQSPYSVRQSLRNLRDLINTNVTAQNAKLCRWVTLTYRENMRDTKRLYNDFRTFHMRLQRHLKREGLPGYEYIACAEPQGRGAWHLHVILIFKGEKAPFLPSSTIEKIWGHGYARVKAVDGVDNIGLYLSAYLGDMELTEAFGLGLTEAGPLAEAKHNSEGARKAVVKGARLRLYPPGFRIFRHSRGIQYPEVLECTEQEAQKIIGGAKLTYEKTIRLIDGQDRVINTISYRHFNRNVREKEGQQDGGQGKAVPFPEGYAGNPAVRQDDLTKTAQRPGTPCGEGGEEIPDHPQGAGSVGDKIPGQGN